VDAFEANYSIIMETAIIDVLITGAVLGFTTGIMYLLFS